MPQPIEFQHQPEGQHAAFFKTTRWSRVVAAGKLDGDQSRQALEDLCRDYWKPLYFYARRKGSSPEDAQDLTQGFIAKFLEDQTYTRANRSLGRFRSFLISCFSRYMASEYRSMTTLKRGGGRAVISYDEAELEESYAAQDLAAPDLLYERSWAAALLDRAMHRLRDEYVLAGRLAIYEAIQPLIAGTGKKMEYARLAAGLGIKENTFTVSVHRMRRRYGQILREEIAGTVESESDIEDELRYLISVVS